MKYKDFFTEMSAMGHSFSAPQPDFDRYHTHNPDPHAKDSDYCEDCMQEETSPDFTEFAKTRMGGASDISKSAKEKGGDAKLTYHHFHVKLPYYQNAIDGKFDVEEANAELQTHLETLSNKATTIGQVEFQELVGIIEVLGELIIKHKEIKKINETISLLEKNVPTSPDKWAKAKSAARSKFKVYPSAYANLWASKKYKSMGGEWKTEK
jgi:hypothetical protein